MLLAAALLIASPAHAGRDAPVVNVTDTPVAWMPGAQKSVDTVARAIITACARLGWVCSIASPGEIKGRLNLRNAQYARDPGPLDPDCACAATPDRRWRARSPSLPDSSPPRRAQSAPSRHPPR